MKNTLRIYVILTRLDRPALASNQDAEGAETTIVMAKGRISLCCQCTISEILPAWQPGIPRWNRAERVRCSRPPEHTGQDDMVGHSRCVGSRTSWHMSARLLP